MNNCPSWSDTLRRHVGGNWIGSFDLNDRMLRQIGELGMKHVVKLLSWIEDIGSTAKPLNVIQNYVQLEFCKK